MELNPFEDSSPILSQPDALRARMSEQGYLFVPGLMPSEAVREVGGAILDLCREHGWADADGHARGEPVLEGHEGWFDVYDPLQRLECFHALAHRPELVHLAEAIAAERVLVHPRHIGRITFPGAAHYTTPPHQDFPLIQGADDTYTAWMPLCDCPIELGGLAVLAQSHKVGRLPVHAAAGPGGLAVDHELAGRDWRAQDLRAGDVLLFHSHTVHRALPNVTDRGLRISVDYRYQGVSLPVVEDSLLPHYMRLDWDTIYADWRDEGLKYYWRKLPITVVERDISLQQPA